MNKYIPICLSLLVFIAVTYQNCSGGLNKISKGLPSPDHGVALTSYKNSQIAFSKVTAKNVKDQKIDFGSKKIIGYFPSWGVYGRNYHVKDIPGNLLTHVNYAFANIKKIHDKYECVLGDPYADTQKFYPETDDWKSNSMRGNFNQLRIFKTFYPHVKILISVGGWTWSKNFPKLAQTDALRNHFAKSCVKFMNRYGFDGIDLDWEFPGPGRLAGGSVKDKQHLVDLVKSIRSELTSLSNENKKEPYLLTLATSAGVEKIQYLDIVGMKDHINWINIMTYDFHGSWEATTNHNAPLRGYNPSQKSAQQFFNIESAVRAHYNQGSQDTPSILTLGLPFYGRCWSDASALYAKAKPCTKGSFEKGMLDYKDIVKNYLEHPSYQKGFDTLAEVPYLANGHENIFISYDDEQSLLTKVQYAQEQNLGGVMIWSLDSDTSDNHLLRSIFKGFYPNTTTQELDLLAKKYWQSSKSAPTDPVPPPSGPLTPIQNEELSDVAIVIPSKPPVVTIPKNPVLIENSKYLQEQLEVKIISPAHGRNSGEFGITIQIKNKGTNDIQDWKIEFFNDYTLNSGWNIEPFKFPRKTHFVLKGASWNKIIKRRSKTSIGMRLLNDGKDFRIHNITFKGIDKSPPPPFVAPATPEDPAPGGDRSQHTDAVQSWTFKKTNVSYTIAGQWKTGVHLKFKIANNGTIPINNWTLNSNMPNVVTSYWKARYSLHNMSAQLKSPTWRGYEISPGGSYEFGMIIRPPLDDFEVSQFVINQENP